MKSFLDLFDSGSLGVISGGLIARFLATFLSVACAGLNIRERVFVAIAWIPKATVQAAMGSIPLDIARFEKMFLKFKRTPNSAQLGLLIFLKVSSDIQES